MDETVSLKGCNHNPPVGTSPDPTFFKRVHVIGVGLMLVVLPFLVWKASLPWVGGLLFGNALGQWLLRTNGASVRNLLRRGSERRFLAGQVMIRYPMVAALLYAAMVVCKLEPVGIALGYGMIQAAIVLSAFRGRFIGKTLPMKVKSDAR